MWLPRQRSPGLPCPAGAGEKGTGKYTFLWAWAVIEEMHMQPELAKLQRDFWHSSTHRQLRFFQKYLTVHWHPAQRQARQNFAGPIGPGDSILCQLNHRALTTQIKIQVMWLALGAGIWLLLTWLITQSFPQGWEAKERADLRYICIHVCLCIFLIKGGRVYLILQSKEGYSLSWQGRHSSSHRRWLVTLHDGQEAGSGQEIQMNPKTQTRPNPKDPLWPSAFTGKYVCCPWLKDPFSSSLSVSESVEEHPGSAEPLVLQQEDQRSLSSVCCELVTQTQKQRSDKQPQWAAEAGIVWGKKPLQIRSNRDSSGRNRFLQLQSRSGRQQWQRPLYQRWWQMWQQWQAVVVAVALVAAVVTAAMAVRSIWQVAGTYRAGTWSVVRKGERVGNRR